MSKDKLFYWIKLRSDFFDLPAIEWLSEQENGYAYIVLYQKLCLITMNTSGELSQQIGEVIAPYDAKRISRATNFDIDTVVVALELYRQLGLIYEQENGVLKISGLEKMVGSESKWAGYKREARGKKTEKLDNVQSMSKKCPTKSLDNVQQEYKSSELKSLESIKSLEFKSQSQRGEDTHLYGAESLPDAGEPESVSVQNDERQRIDYAKIQGMYNAICTALPRCTAMSDSRKKAIRARMSSGYTTDDFQRLFEMAADSPFLCGAGDRDWRATFDWLIKDANMAKVLDGNYSNKRSPSTPSPRTSGEEADTTNPFLKILWDEHKKEAVQKGEDLGTFEAFLGLEGLI